MVVGRWVPLYVQRLGRFLGAEIRGRRLEVIVVGLPHERRPAGMAHPQQQAHAVGALRLEHGAVAFIVHELGERDPIRGIAGAAVSRVDAAAECGPAFARH